MNEVTQPMPDMVLEMTGTFDIARARNRLRQLVDTRKLPLMLRARSSAALTTLAEMVLFKSENREGELQLGVRVLDDEMDVQGIEFSFFAPLTSDISKRFAIAEWQLERSCDEIGISNRGKYDFIVMRLWARRRKQ